VFDSPHQRSYADLTPSSMMVSDDKANDDDQDRRCADVTITGLGELPLTIVGTYSSDELAGRSLPVATSSRIRRGAIDSPFFINTADGVTDEQACAAIQPLVDEYGTGEPRAAASTSMIRRRGSTSCWR
jgi:hypothetical protein